MGKSSAPMENQLLHGLRLLSFDDADVQVVAGTMVELMVDVSVEGCGTTVYKFDSVIDLDGMFTLTDYTIGNTATGSMLLPFTMVIPASCNN